MNICYLNSWYWIVLMVNLRMNTIKKIKMTFITYILKYYILFVAFNTYSFKRFLNVLAFSLSFSNISGDLSIVSSASIAAVVSNGGSEALKQYPAP